MPLSFTVDENRARATLEGARPAGVGRPRRCAPRPRRPRACDDVPGTALDVDATLVAIVDGDRDFDAIFSVSTKPVAANVTSKMLADVDVSKVLASFETNFAGTGRGRAVNIARAAKALNEVVIAPLQTISFNDLVGPRKLERGFTWAPVIIGDELKPGVGGGCCQVASTLHAAAVYGFLDVVRAAQPQPAQRLRPPRSRRDGRLRRGRPQDQKPVRHPADHPRVRAGPREAQGRAARSRSPGEGRVPVPRDQEHGFFPSGDVETVARLREAYPPAKGDPRLRCRQRGAHRRRRGLWLGAPVPKRLPPGARGLLDRPRSRPHGRCPTCPRAPSAWSSISARRPRTSPSRRRGRALRKAGPKTAPKPA